MFPATWVDGYLKNLMLQRNRLSSASSCLPRRSPVCPGSRVLKPLTTGIATFRTSVVVFAEKIIFL